MNVLLVGLGRWGEKHLRVLRELGATVWVADVAPARLEWAQKQGVESRRAVRDYRTALASVDAVDIVTPADSHRAIAGECLAAGRHCFIEKPFTTTVAEAYELEAATRAAGRVVQVGHVFRFHPVTATLREALGAGRIGRVRYATGPRRSRSTWASSGDRARPGRGWTRGRRICRSTVRSRSGASSPRSSTRARAGRRVASTRALACGRSSSSRPPGGRPRSAVPSRSDRA